MIEDEVMQNALINEKINVNVKKMQNDNCMILFMLFILISKLKN